MQEIGYGLFAGAQDACWINDKFLVAVSWNRALSLYSLEASAMKLCDVKILENLNFSLMVARLSDTEFLVSGYENDALSAFTINEEQKTIHNSSSWKFPESVYGGADCGLLLDTSLLITGHANGYILAWNTQTHEPTELFDFSNATTPLKNIRGFALYQEQFVLACSENKNIYLLDIPNKIVLLTQLYNPDAKLGINSISCFGSRIIVGVCKEHSEEANTWVYNLSKSDEGHHVLATVGKYHFGEGNSFAFCVRAVSTQKFLISALDGRLFYLSLDSQNRTADPLMVDPKAGAVIALHPNNQLACVVCRDVKLVKIL
jgi:WD40 repeat protein